MLAKFRFPGHLHVLFPFEILLYQVINQVVNHIFDLSRFISTVEVFQFHLHLEWCAPPFNDAQDLRLVLEFGSTHPFRI